MRSKIIHLSRHKRTERYITSISKSEMDSILTKLKEDTTKYVELNYTIDKEKFLLSDIDLIGKAENIEDKDLFRLLPITEVAKEKGIYYRSHVYSNIEPYEQLELQKCSNSREKYNKILNQLGNPEYCIIFNRKKNIVEV